MHEDHLRELLDDVLAAGDSLAEVLGLTLTATLDESLDEADVKVVREAILSWRRLRGDSVAMLSL